MKLTDLNFKGAFGSLFAKSGMGWVQEWLRGQDLDDRGRGASLTNAFQQSVWVYSCINTLAANVAETEFKFCLGSKDGENPIESGPLVDLFDRPHPLMNRFAFWELYVTWLCLRGEVFIVPIQLGRNLWQLLVMPPDSFMHIVQGHELVGWRYTGAATQTPLESQLFLPEEIIHDKLPNPFNFWRGMSPLSVAMLAAQTDYASAQFMKGLMLNNADTGAIITTEQQLTAEQREYVLAALRDRKRTAGTADRPLLLFAGAKVEKPTLCSADMQMLENRKYARQEICAVYGVPQELIGFTEDANRSVSDSARLNFTEHRIAPLCERIEAAIGPFVKRVGGPRVCGYFDVDTRPIMQQARNSRVDIAVKYFGLGVPLNVINKNLDLGLPDLAWGNEGYLPFNLVQVGSNPTAEAQSSQSPDGTTVPQQDGLGRACDAVTKLLVDGAARSPHPGPLPRGESCRTGTSAQHECAANPEYEASISGSIKAKAGRMRKFFFEQRSRVLAAVAEQFGSKAAALSPHPGPLPQGEGEEKAHDARLEQIFDIKNENSLLKARLKPALVADLEFGGAQLFAELGLGDFALPPSKAIEFLNKRAKRIEDINQTTFDALKGSLQEGLEAGDSYELLVDRVKEVFTTAGESRAETIATTETNTAINTGRHEGMVEAKVELKGWKTANLENVRATHAAAERDYSDGIPIDAAFRVGGFDLMYPGDPSGPPQEVINCRCFSFPVMGKKGHHSKADGSFPLTPALSPEEREKAPAALRGKLLTWSEWEKRKG